MELALLKAGLIRKENFGDFQRLKWSRSSRTDKGVHSLATVLGFRAECEPARWAADPEGLDYAAAINRCALRSICSAIEGMFLG